MAKKIVRVIRRDQGRPIKAGVRSETSPVEVIAERGPTEWHPIHGQRIADGTQVELPRGFTLNGESMAALDRAE